ncbi:MAG: formyltransferase family protein [Bdellovibrionota bacterium]
MKILLLGPLWRNAPIRDFLQSKGNEVECTGEPITLDFAQSKHIEFIISSGYGPIIRPEVVHAFPRRVINLHATYLPYGKGIGTTFFSVFEGTPTGVSIHYIDEKIDTGDVIVRRLVPYSSGDTLRTFYGKLLAATEQLFRDTWDQIAASTNPTIPQRTFELSVPYRSRVDSERFMDLLPLKWDTPLTTVEAMGAEFFCSENFWLRFEADIVPAGASEATVSASTDRLKPGS